MSLSNTSKNMMTIIVIKRTKMERINKIRTRGVEKIRKRTKIKVSQALKRVPQALTERINLDKNLSTYLITKR